MPQLTTKIAIPIIFVGIFAIAVFMAIGYDQLQPNGYAVILLLLVFIFFFGLAAGQSVASPVKKLLDTEREISSGNLFSRVNLETSDELSELAGALNKIAEELEISRLREMNMEKTVGIKVKAKTQELEETINALEQKVKNRTIELERLIEESNKLRGAVKEKK